MGVAMSCVTGGTDEEQCDLENQLNASHRWADRLEKQVNLLSRELNEKKIDLEIEQERKYNLVKDNYRLANEIEVLKDILRDRETKENELRFELKKASVVIRYYDKQSGENQTAVKFDEDEGETPDDEERESGDELGLYVSTQTARVI